MTDLERYQQDQLAKLAHVDALESAARAILAAWDSGESEQEHERMLRHMARVRPTLAAQLPALLQALDDALPPTSFACPSCKGTRIEYSQRAVMTWTVSELSTADEVILNHKDDDPESGHFYCLNSECLRQWAPDNVELEYRY
jgi:hypothetical protein